MKQKEDFEFEYSMPSLDWFNIKEVKITPDEYYYFRLERRFGPSWWLVGLNPIEEPNYHWEETEIGRLEDFNLARFIKWAKTDMGSKLIEIKAICGTFDILEEARRLLLLMK